MRIIERSRPGNDALNVDMLQKSVRGEAHCTQAESRIGAVVRSAIRLVDLGGLYRTLLKSVPTLLLFAGLFLSGCEIGETATPPLSEILAEDRPDQESWNTVFNVMDGDLPRVHIIAGYMAKYDQADSSYMHLLRDPDSLDVQVIAHLFDENGDSSAVLFTNELYYFEEDRRFEAQGNVRVETHDDRLLETEQLEWLETERKVRTDGFVRITTPTENIQGYELDADEDLQNYELSRVSGEVDINEEEDAPSDSTQVVP